MIIFGASGHAKVIADCLLENGWEILFFIDDDPNKTRFLGKNVIRRSEFIPSTEKVILGIGDNSIRKKIASSLIVQFGNSIHPSAIISSRVILLEGSVVFHGAIVQTETKIGRHCIINTRASIDHECIIGDFVHVAPGAILCGNVSVGEGTFVGAGSIVKQGVVIGKNVTIGAGTVVLENVPDNVTLVGNPGRIIK